MKLSRYAPHNPFFSKFYYLCFTALIVCGMGCALASHKAEAKDFSPRLGLGATDVGPGFRSPALSLDWQLSEATGFEVNLGLDTQNSSNTFLLSLRYERNLFIENQQSFFLYMGGGILTVPNTGAAAGSATNAAGYIVETGVGVKFFFEEFPNLGFSLGTGFRLESPVSVRIRIAVFGGFHYYF